MTTRQATLASPTHSQPPYENHHGDLSSLDFLSLIGLDESGVPEVNGFSEQPEAGPSNFNTQGDRRDSITDDREGYSEALQVNASMDVDHSSGMEGMEGLMSLYGQDYDAVQSGILQRHLEHIHMQSPIGFDGTNPESPYNPMAQMYIPSPSHVVTRQQSTRNSREGGQKRKHLEDASGNQSQWQSAGSMGGVMTPAPSGDIFPQTRTDLMSPMQLEMLARGESIDVNPDFNIVPLLSPALTHHAGASTFVSPAGHAAFPANPNAHPNSSSTSYSHNHARSPIEQLQDQHRQFQEQLTQLQQQQRQLQVTAAAVAASTSPNVPTSGPGSGQSRPVSTPGAAHSRSTGSIGTPSPRYFSPLTSPALDGSARATHFAQHHGFSPAFGPQGHRQPHPLSALSSPALNPVGSSGGAQQTLSPALEPQQNGDSGDPEYIRALLGLLNGQAQGENHHQTFNQSPNHQPTLASPLGGPTNGPGPNRQSLPSKTRPSPMMKPTNHHRSQARHSTGSAFSVPSSPMAVRYQPEAPGVGFLPPAAIDQRGVQRHYQAMQQGASTSSTPSPVDLSHIMPPPPVPHASAVKGITPMTPASLMNLASGQAVQMQPVPLPKRQVLKAAVPAVQKGSARKGATAGAMATTAKKGNGSKLAPGPGGKRAYANRGTGNAGIKAANDSVAAAARVPPEGETRRSSHKVAEQRRRDSLKAGFDELRLLLPPINTEAIDPETGELIPGSSAPRLLPKSSRVPDDNPNRGVSKVALLRFSNEYIVKLHDKVGKRDSYTDKLRDEVRRLRGGRGQEVRGEEGEDLLDMDMLAGEEDDFGEADAHGERVEEEEDADMEEDEGDEEEDEEEGVARGMGVMPRRAGAGQKVGSSGVTVAAGPKSGRRARD